MDLDKEKAFVGTTTLSMVPDDCLRAIFLYLPVLERIQLREVCKKWKRTSDDCWREVKYLSVFNYKDKKKENYITGDSKQINVHSKDKVFTIGFVKRCAPYVTTVRSSQFSQEFSILPAMKSCCNVKDLTIVVDSKANDAHMSSVFAKNRQIESLYIILEKQRYKCLKKLSTDALAEWTIEAPSFANKKIQKAFSTILKQKIDSCQKLKYLRVAYFGDDEIFKAIGEKKTLTHLHVFSEHSSDFSDLTACGLNNVSKLNNLQTLSLSLADGLITDTCLKNVGENCKSLTSIYLLPCDEVTDEGLRALTFLSKLEDLEIICAQNITDTYLMYFCKVNHLAITNAAINDAGVIELLRTNPNLNSLDLRYTDISIETIRVAAEEIKKRTNDVALCINIHEDLDLSELRDPLPENLFVSQE